MDKKSADTLATNIAIQICSTDPSFIAKDAANSTKATLVADFIKHLSTRFQQDLDDIPIGHIKLR